MIKNQFNSRCELDTGIDYNGKGLAEIEHSNQLKLCNGRGVSECTITMIQVCLLHIVASLLLCNSIM